PLPLLLLLFPLLLVLLPLSLSCPCPCLFHAFGRLIPFLQAGHLPRMCVDEQ
ncbi:hypothetical protein Nmel_008147, partial [Mimus melanotis]